MQLHYINLRSFLTFPFTLLYFKGDRHAWAIVTLVVLIIDTGFAYNAYRGFMKERNNPSPRTLCFLHCLYSYYSLGNPLSLLSRPLIAPASTLFFEPQRPAAALFYTPYYSLLPIVFS